MGLVVDDAHNILSLVGPYIYKDRQVLDHFICETLGVFAEEVRQEDLFDSRKFKSNERDTSTEFEDTSDESDGPEHFRSHTSSERSRIRKAQAAGECHRCLVHETPQWRYVHHLRFCNACYMRIKRFTEQAKPGYKLPPRAKPSSMDDPVIAQLAVDLTKAAFA